MLRHRQIPRILTKLSWAGGANLMPMPQKTFCPFFSSILASPAVGHTGQRFRRDRPERRPFCGYGRGRLASRWEATNPAGGTGTNPGSENKGNTAS